MTLFNSSCTAIMRLQSRIKIPVPLRTKSSIAGIKQGTSTESSTYLEFDQKELARARPFEEIPGPRGLQSLPYIGAIFHLKPFTKYTMETFHQLVYELQERHGPTFRVQLDKPHIIVSDPKDFETINRYEGKYPWRPGVDIAERFFQRTGKKPDMSNLQGEGWQILRSAINKSFLRPHNVLQFLGTQNAVGDDFVRLIATNDVYKNHMATCDPFFWYAAESVAVILFNRRIGFLDQNVDEDAKDYIQATSDMFDLMNKSLVGEILMYRFFKDKTYRKYEWIKHYIEKQIMKYIRDVKEKAEAKKKNGTFDPDEPNITLALLNEGMSEIDVANTLESLYVAATESTAGTLQVCFFALAMNPDKQDILRREVLGRIGRDGPLTKEALRDMAYLKATLKECYRYKSPVTFPTIRVLPVDVVLGGYKVPALTRVIGYNRHLQLQGFTDPDRFLPERWLRDDGGKRKQVEHSKWAVIPFGHGPRGCIGKGLAEQELYIAMSKTLQKYKIGVAPDSRDTHFEYRLFIRPVNPIKFTFTPV